MKNTIIVVAILAFAGLLYWGYTYMKPNSASTTGEKKMAAQEPVSGMMSLTDLMKMGATQTCTFESTNEQGTTTGTSYLSGNKVRTDFKTVASGQETEGHVIMDGSYMYTWTNASEPGFKVQLTEDMTKMMEDVRANADEYKQQLDPNAKVDYKCSTWNIDTNQFTPPSNITFNDFSEQMKMMQDSLKQMQQNADSASPDMKTQQCAACESLQGEAATACKQALGC